MRSSEPPKSTAQLSRRTRPPLGRDWPTRKAKLARGHNADYWVSKIQRNVDLDCQRNLELAVLGWSVVRVWESDINQQLDHVVERIASFLRA